MGYLTLKTLHVLAVGLWVGGMAFAHFFLRPALGTLEPPQRLKPDARRAAALLQRRAGGRVADPGQRGLDDRPGRARRSGWRRVGLSCRWTGR
jgi:hypothetical protein